MFSISGCSKNVDSSKKDPSYTEDHGQGFTNGEFEQGNETNIYNWTIATICGTAPCAQRINTGNNINAYSLDIKAVANNAWSELVRTKASELNSPSTIYTLEFDFNCITATTSNGWHMFFRDANHTCCVDVANDGTTQYTDGTKAIKNMKAFTCSAGEKGHYTATFTTPTQKNTDYYWYIYAWINTTNNQEIVMDNFRLYKKSIIELDSITKIKIK